MSNPSTDPNINITHPVDLAGASLCELLDAWHAHMGPLVDARYRFGEPLPPARLARHALDALAAGQALAESVTRSRWVTALDALANGAPLAHVAAAMGLDVDEMAAGLRSWADGQVRIGSMTPAQCDEVYARLGEVTR